MRREIRNEQKRQARLERARRKAEAEEQMRRDEKMRLERLKEQRRLEAKHHKSFMEFRRGLAGSETASP